MSLARAAKGVICRAICRPWTRPNDAPKCPGGRNVALRAFHVPPETRLASMLGLQVLFKLVVRG
jgi:hypothetical protein